MELQQCHQSPVVCESRLFAPLGLVYEPLPDVRGYPAARPLRIVQCQGCGWEYIEHQTDTAKPHVWLEHLTMERRTELGL